MNEEIKKDIEVLQLILKEKRQQLALLKDESFHLDIKIQDIDEICAHLERQIDLQKRGLL